MNWDPFQREVLAELGHRLYRMRANETPLPVASPEPAASTATVDPLWRALVRAAGRAGQAAVGARATLSFAAHDGVIVDG